MVAEEWGILGDYPFDYIRPPASRPVIAVVVWGLLGGIALAYTAWFFWNWLGFFRPDRDFSFNFGAHLVFVLSVPFAVLLLKYARRMWRRDAFWILRRDRRPPILFLRSFADDGGAWWQRLKESAPLEERLARALSRIGPMIAIGRPGERYPELGASRFYVPDHAWKDAVTHFLDRASVVVIFVGPSEGVLWEIEEALTRVDRSRLLLCFPYLEDRGRMWRNMFSLRAYGSEMQRRMQQERDRRYAFFIETVGARTGIRFPKTLGTAVFLDFEYPDTARPILSRGRVGKLTQSAGQETVRTDYARTLRPFIGRITGREMARGLGERLANDAGALKRARNLFVAAWVILMLVPMEDLAVLKFFSLPVIVVGLITFRRAIRRVQRLQAYGAENRPSW